jgi:uracil-DNA glycosylase
MSNGYDQLLDAAIGHLKELKARGVRHVSVTPQSLAGLKAQPRAAAARKPAPTAPAAPATRVAPNPPPESKPAGPPTSEPGPAAEKPLAVGLPGEPADAGRAAALSPEAKAVAFAALRERVLACAKCDPLVAARQNVVFGVGDINAQLMFVGEAPGADEDEQGEPFVGKAGQLLTKIIQAMGLTRDTVYIANILKCRPDTPGQSAGNRKPTPEEMQTCLPYLHEQIDLIRPKVIVALGATAVEGLLGKTIGITRLRGNWRTYRGIPLMPTYHPAYLLRNQALSEKRRVWEDMLQVMEKLGMPVSQKQRNYFLKA